MNAIIVTLSFCRLNAKCEVTSYMYFFDFPKAHTLVYMRKINMSLIPRRMTSRQSRLRETEDKKTTHIKKETVLLNTTIRSFACTHEKLCLLQIE